VYLVTTDAVDRRNPCPSRPMEGVDVTCSDVHRPNTPTYVDSTYTVVELEGSTGDVVDSTSYVGSDEAVVYVSRDSLYLTYARAETEADVLLDFVEDNPDVFDARTVDRLEQVRGYDLSDRALVAEVESVLDDYMQSLDDDERLDKRNELENAMEDYVDDNLREYESTEIVEVSLEGLEAVETAEVPGHPLNQFSLDEHDGRLRVATTVGESRALRGAESVSDVYVLDDEFDVVGSARDMGEGQRIYSVRFAGDQAYLVTFRQVDPFYVVDLSDPSAPSVEGELKLPGYSSYLHPLSDDRVLGIGMEDRRVKTAVFDVSDPTEPSVESEFVLDESASDAVSASVGNTAHRAFLLDERHEVFFLPGRSGGYVFSYADELELVRAVDTGWTRRAVYVDDTLYVFADTEAVALDMTTWDRVGELEFDVDARRPVEPIPEPTPQPDVEFEGTAD
ncbi:MAG: beta-propeller domain-containing protein, partial [Halobacteriota archaeon]